MLIKIFTVHFLQLQESETMRDDCAKRDGLLELYPVSLNNTTPNIKKTLNESMEKEKKKL